MLEQNSDTHIRGMFSDDNTAMLQYEFCLGSQPTQPATKVAGPTNVPVSRRSGENFKRCPFPRREGVYGSRGIAPLILNLGTRWVWVVIITSRPLYLPERTHSTGYIGGWVDPRGERSLVLGVIQNLHRPCRGLACIEYRTAVPTKILKYLIQGAAEITPTFWRSIKIKRNKVHRKFFYL